MADPPHIKQEIRVEYDGKGAEQAAAGLDKVEQNTEATAKTAATYAAEADRLTQELTELATVEDRYQRALVDGADETKDGRRESEQRRRSIERLSREVAEAESHEERLNRELRESVGAHRQAGEAVAGGVKSMSTFGTAAGLAKNAMSGLVAGMIGREGLELALDFSIEKMDAFNERLERNAELTLAAAEARLNFIALQGFEKPEDIAFIGQVSGFAGRDNGEIARSMAQFKSQFPNASDADIKSLTVELASAGQSTDAALDDLAPGIAALYRETGDARVAGNIFQQSQTEAGEYDPAKFAPVLSRWLAVSDSIGGLDVGQRAGYAAAATGLGVGTEESITGMTNVLFALMGEGTPAGKEIREREDIDGEDFELALRQVSRAVVEGRITGAELEQLGGREAAPIFGALSDPKKFNNFMASAERVDQAEDYDGRLNPEKSQNIVELSHIQELRLLRNQIDEQAKNERSNDERAVTIATVRAELERQLEAKVASEEIAPYMSTRILEAYDARINLGEQPEDAIDMAERVTSGVRFPLTTERFPNAPPVFGGKFEDLAGYGLKDSVMERIRRGPQTDPQPLLDQINAPDSVPDAAGPLSAAGDTATHERLDRLIVAVERLAIPGPGSPPAADPFGQSAAVGGGGVTIYGDVFTHGDPALEGLGEAYLHG